MSMSARTVARAIGVEFTGLRTARKEVHPAPETVVLPQSGLVIKAGTVGGVRWTWEASSADGVFLTIVNEQTAVFGLGADWRQSDEEPAWTVDIDASPPLHATLSWPAGIPHALANAHLNAARAINVVTTLVDAQPGCWTLLELPMITGYGVRG
jgi:2,4-diaminopentanoate dehydrogenase